MIFLNVYKDVLGSCVQGICVYPLQNMSPSSCVGSPSQFPSCFGKQVLLLEGPTFLPYEDYSINGGYDWEE